MKVTGNEYVIMDDFFNKEGNEITALTQWKRTGRDNGQEKELLNAILVLIHDSSQRKEVLIHD